jgi:hypothetical protein
LNLGFGEAGTRDCTSTIHTSSIRKRAPSNLDCLFDRNVINRFI